MRVSKIIQRNRRYEDFLDMDGVLADFGRGSLCFSLARGFTI